MSVSFKSLRVSTNLSLQSLVVCEWVHMSTVFVMIVFMPKLCLKYNNVPQPYLKHPGCVTKKINSLKVHLINSVTQELLLIEQFYKHIGIQRGNVYKKCELVFRSH